MRTRPFILAALLAAVVRADYTAPLDLVAAERPLAAVHEEIVAGRFAEAAAKVEALLAEPAKYVKVDERFVPIAGWVESQLTADTRPAFAAAYEAIAGLEAGAALLEAQRTDDVAALRRVAARYPWSQSAQAATAAAAERLIADGDVRGAKAVLVGLPSDSLTPSQRAVLTAPDDGAGQPALFPAAWYQAYQPFTDRRVVPVAAGESVFFASPKGVLAMTDKGRKKWATADVPPEQPQVEEMDKNGRPLPKWPEDKSLSQPAVWCDLSGRPRVVVARQTSLDASVLRAYHADTGAVLWEAAGEAGQSRVFAGVPVIAGGQVYSLCVRAGGDLNGPRMTLAALELASGRTLFETDLGTGGPQIVANIWPKPRPLTGDQVYVAAAAFRNDCVPVVQGDAVYVSFPGGSVAAVDRFGGGVRWVSSYTVAKERARHEIEREQKGKNPVTYRRFENRPLAAAGLVAVTPIDSDGVFVYDAKTGRKVWSDEAVRGYAAVALDADGVCLFGRDLLRIRFDGTERLALPINIDNAKPTGPVRGVGGFLFVPRAGGPLKIDLASRGLRPRVEGDPASINDSLRLPLTRKELEKLDLLRFFDWQAAEANETPKPTPKPPARPVERPKGKR